MFKAIRTLVIATTLMKETSYNDENLLKCMEYKVGQEILNNTDFIELLVSDKYKTAEQCKKILSTPQGCYMLGHNPPLITVEQAAKFHTEFYLKTVVSVDGIIMLKHNPPIMTIEQMLTVPILFSLQALVSKYGAIALEEGLITVDEAKKIAFFYLESILTHNGLIALRKELITVKQLIDHAEWGGSMHVYLLTTPQGMKCMLEGSMTYDLSQTMDAGALGKELERLNPSNKLLKTSDEPSVTSESISSYKPGR
jgi:hypothetical protein